MKMDIQDKIIVNADNSGDESSQKLMMNNTLMNLYNEHENSRKGSKVSDKLNDKLIK